MLKIGLFGAGHLGKIHAKLIRELRSTFEFVGFFEPNNEKANAVGIEFAIRRFDSADDLISAVDCVDIVTPTLSHFEVASAAARLKKHIFVEKPITTTVDEANELCQLARQFNIKLQVGHVERFNPAFKNALPYISDPMFIETHRLAQYNPRGTDVPVVLDLMIHDLDIILSVVKSNVARISASGVAVISETPDITNARIEFENGCVANLTASRISMKNMRKSRFFQKDAYISVDFLAKQSEIVKITAVHGEPDPFDIVFDPGEGKTKKKIEILKPAVSESNAIQEELSSFADAIANNLKPTVSGEDGRNALNLARQVMTCLNGPFSD